MTSSLAPAIKRGLIAAAAYCSLTGVYWAYIWYQTRLAYHGMDWILVWLLTSVIARATQAFRSRLSQD